jgi:hypothetical protein
MNLVMRLFAMTIFASKQRKSRLLLFSASTANKHQKNLSIQPLALPIHATFIAITSKSIQIRQSTPLHG